MSIETGSDLPTGTPASSLCISFVGLYLIALSLLFLYLAVQFWPDCSPATICPAFESRFTVYGYLIWNVRWMPTVEIRLLCTAAIFGAIGSYIHIAASFADYVGNRRLVASWIWWFIMRTPIGMSLAIVFYMAIRAGFMTTSGGSGETNGLPINPFGVAAISAMVGMFSKQATDKLNEVFSTMFKTNADASRGDKLTTVGPPKIASIDPSPLSASQASYAITVKGTGFTDKTQVKINDRAFKPNSATETEIKLTATGLILAAGDKVKIVVANPPEAGGDSAAFDVAVA